MNLFETNRLQLRELKTSDASDVFEYCKQVDIVNMVGMRFHTSIDVSSKYIEHELKKRETYAIVLKDDEKLIGTVSLRKQENDSKLDIRLVSCVLNPVYWGNGYAAEAIKILLKQAFEKESVHKVIGGHYSFNKQSETLNKKLGFVYEGTLREVKLYNGKLIDVVQYSMLLEDYRKASKEWK